MDNMLQEGESFEMLADQPNMIFKDNELVMGPKQNKIKNETEERQLKISYRYCT